MAGEVSKVAGGLAVLLGIVLFVGGIGAAAYGFLDQQEHEDEALLEDRERTEVNEALMMGGAVAAVLGLAALVTSILLFVAGGARAQRAHRDQRDQRNQTAAVVADDAAAEHTAVQSDPGGRPAIRPSAKTLSVATGAIVVATMALFAALMGGSSGDRLALFGEDEPQRLDVASHHGSIEMTLMNGAGGSQAVFDNDNQFPYTPPASAQRVFVAVTWTPEQDGAEQLDVYILDAEGNELARQSGGEPLYLNATATAGTTLEIHVYPEGAGFVVAQGFAVTIEAWDR